MSHWKCTSLLSGNLNMEYSVASAAPAFSSYLNCEMTRGFTGHLKITRFAVIQHEIKAQMGIQMKIPFGIHRSKSEDNIKMKLRGVRCEDVHWIDVADAIMNS
jgi:hypothetical protein